MVDVRSFLEWVCVYLDRRPLGEHHRCWAGHQTLTDPAYRESAARLRKQYWERNDPSRSAALEVAERDERAVQSTHGPREWLFTSRKPTQNRSV